MPEFRTYLILIFSICSQYPNHAVRLVYSSNPSEEKSDLPELGLEEYHSFEYRISDLNSWTGTVKSDRPSQRGTVRLYCHCLGFCLSWSNKTS